MPADKGARQGVRLFTREEELGSLCATRAAVRQGKSARRLLRRCPGGRLAFPLTYPQTNTTLHHQATTTTYSHPQTCRKRVQHHIHGFQAAHIQERQWQSTEQSRDIAIALSTGRSSGGGGVVAQSIGGQHCDRASRHRREPICCRVTRPCRHCCEAAQI